ncbi:hypothetical protein ROHU_008588 [Labeo rohita]|uniref:Uncharacterized protein n=1 Tax=Labeo rohita TaxID=84645 RepID=A0A498MFV9_LABRO|nr:hypothetical protein ROHU_008588 [Labeo rohita]
MEMSQLCCEKKQRGHESMSNVPSVEEKIMENQRTRRGSLALLPHTSSSTRSSAGGLRISALAGQRRGTLAAHRWKDREAEELGNIMDFEGSSPSRWLCSAALADELSRLLHSRLEDEESRCVWFL